jgi:starch phosphorylase
MAVFIVCYIPLAGEYMPIKKLKSKKSAASDYQISFEEVTPEAFRKSFDTHLHHSMAVNRMSASEYERFLAISYAVRDRLIDRWMQTQKTYRDQDVKRVYYLSLEFLMGRTLGNSLLNLDVNEEVGEALDQMGMNLEELRDLEVDAGLGNGGLGRLAACFLDSMATLEIPAMGMGIRYEFGMFHQKIVNGAQEEQPDNWLRQQNPWEIQRPSRSLQVPFYGNVASYHDSHGKLRHRWEPSQFVTAMPFDTPVPGYKNNTVNNLRLWSAQSANQFGLDYFNSGDYLAAVEDMELSETISKVLYPNDTSMNGKQLRLKQQFFLCSASLQDIVRRWRRTHDNFDGFAEKIAIQLNDTHPAIAIPEMMRLLLDEEHMGWEESWNLVTQVFAYTNHTLLPEALEKWPVFLFEELLPRHLQIIYEINAQFMREVSLRWPGDTDRLSRMSIIEESPEKSVRMAFLSIVGSHAVNGVAALHTDLLENFLFRDFFEMWPEKFNNKTNGVTPRRWVRKANPEMSALISEKIGDDWVKDLSEIKKLEKSAKNKSFQKKFREVKLQKKTQLAEYLLKTQGVVVDPNTMFDVQVKRIHEYKRQLMNILHVIHLYNKAKSGEKILPRTVMIGGKAAPGYWMAKEIIRLSNSVAEVINNDPDTNSLLKLVFLENYRVSFAERIIPAADLSEQISTAGKEASGTGNMKFALNGALTIGTLDGANVEMKEEIGTENIFIFGNTVEDVHRILDEGYRPHAYYDASPRLRRVLDLISSNFFSPTSPGSFDAIVQNLLNVDSFMVLADFDAFCDAQEEVEKAYLDEAHWTEMSILNVARMSKFSSDRTIAEYNKDIWNASQVSIELEN